MESNIIQNVVVYDASSTVSLDVCSTNWMAALNSKKLG